MTEPRAPLLLRLAAGTAPRLLAVGFVLLFVALRCEPVTGLTGLMRFGERHRASRLPALQALPLQPSPGDGYDGQFYAQVAVLPDPLHPDLVRALDKPSYRPRRILLPALAHLLGAGRPWPVLQAYALLNTAAWLVLAAVLARVLPAGEWRASLAWLGCLLAVGTLDSVRLALTDLPAALCLVLAVQAVERGRAGGAAAWCLAAGLVREVSLIGFGLLRAGERPGIEGARRTALRGALAMMPVIGWCTWLAWRLPGPVGHEGNLDWPGLALARALAHYSLRLAAGDLDPQWAFGLMGGLGLAAQSLYLLRRGRAWASDPWIGLGLPFAVLFWVIGADPWLDYRAAARHCLPMTIAFQVVVARTPGAHPLWFAANLSAIDGVLRMTYL